jgi:ribonucleotide reductase alpha subunit
LGENLQEEWTRSPYGVGITAEGDMLAALGLRYGTEEATEFSEKVHKK